VTYGSGGWTLLARSGTYLLLDARPTDRVVSDLWTVAEAPSLEGLLGVLRTELPGCAFCLVRVDGSGVVLAQEGVAATVDGRPAAAGRTPALVALAAGSIVVVSAPGSTTGTQLPIEGGIVAAGSLILVQVPATEQLAPVQPEPAVAPPPSSRPPGPEAPADVPTGMVRALICLQGHRSPASAARCRVCGDDLPPQTARAVLRPSLGVLELESGARVELDRGAVLGRAPQVPAGADDEPHLVDLASYGRDVSRQHVQVVLADWEVYVRDLGSTNGTRLRDAAGQVVTLEPGQLVPLTTGAVLDIAEVTTVTYRAT
jgi:hypothetical protein